MIHKPLKHLSCLSALFCLSGCGFHWQKEDIPKHVMPIVWESEPHNTLAEAMLHHFEQANIWWTRETNKACTTIHLTKAQASFSLPGPHNPGSLIRQYDIVGEIEADIQFNEACYKSAKKERHIHLKRHIQRSINRNQSMARNSMNYQSAEQQLARQLANDMIYYLTQN